jgi:hypothetical protein
MAVYRRPVAWSFEHSADSTAPPAAVWRRYLDVEHWCDWSRQGVEWSRIDGPFEVGTKGRTKPPDGRPISFRLIAVEPDKAFASQVKLPGGRVRFDHIIEPTSAGSRITHRVSVNGPLAFLYARFVRRGVERGLPDGVDRLAAMAATEG